MTNENFKLLSQFWGKDKLDKSLLAEVLWNPMSDSFGCRYLRDDEEILVEWYPGHSEEWAESAAENYTLGVKIIP